MTKLSKDTDMQKPSSSWLTKTIQIMEEGKYLLFPSWLLTMVFHYRKAFWKPLRQGGDQRTKFPGSNLITTSLQIGSNLTSQSLTQQGWVSSWPSIKVVKILHDHLSARPSIQLRRSSTALWRPKRRSRGVFYGGGVANLRARRYAFAIRWPSTRLFLTISS